MTTATKITSIDRTTCRLLSQRIEEALAPLAEELGLNISTVGGGRYTSNNCTLKIECSTLAEDGEANSKMVQDFKSHAALYGLKATDLGRSFRQRRSIFTIKGLNPRRHKNPIIVENQNGKSYVFPADTVKRLLA